MNIKKLLRPVLAILVAFSILPLSGCGKKEDNNVLKIGVIAGPEAQLMQVAIEQAKERFDLNAKLVPFQDYVTPDIALADGSIDVNAYQHQAYLDDINKSRGFSLVSAGKTFLYPMGFYSKKIKTLAALPDGAKIAVPNDPSNESRALYLLQDTGLIKLGNTSEQHASIRDITYNPKKLVFIELDAAQLPRSLDDVDLAGINSTFAVASGLLPTRDGLLVEKSDSPYVNIFATQKDKSDNVKIQQLVKSFQSEAVLKKAREIFKGGAIPGWK